MAGRNSFFLAACRSLRRPGISLAVLLAALLIAAARAEFTAPVAVTDVTIVPEPGQLIERGTILIDRGRIVSAGTDVDVPAHAEVVDGWGLVAYPGFIDACTHLGIPRKPADEAELTRLQDEAPEVREGPVPNMFEANRNGLTPHWRTVDLYEADAKALKAHRQAGFTAALVAPRPAIVGGRSALLNLGDAPLRRSVVRADVAMHAGFATFAAFPFGPDAPARQPRESLNHSGYPATIMGAMAHFRQAMHDARWYSAVHAYAAGHPEMWPRPPFDAVLAALQPMLAGELPAVFEANSDKAIHRAMKLSGEFGLRLMVAGGREAWRTVERIRQQRVPLIVSLKFSEEPPKVEEEAPATQPTTAPATQPSTRPAPATQPADEEEWEKQEFEPAGVRRERRRQWEEELDNLVRLHEAGIAFALGSFELDSPAELLKNLRKVIGRGLSEEVALAALTTRPAEMFGVSGQIGRIAPGRLANLCLLSGKLSDEKAKVVMVFVEGRKFELDREAAERKDEADGRRRGRRGKPEEQEPTATQPTATQPTATQPQEEAAATQPVEEPATAPTEAAADALRPNLGWRFETDAERMPAVQTGGDILLRNATVLTVSGGTLEEADVLVRAGKIAAVGTDLEAPAGVRTVDLTGYFVMPGIIDPHSHMCSDGGLNEWTLSVTPEVSVYDVIDNYDLAMCRALAGGVTTVLTLHGSANTIGGQSAVLKLKYRRPVEQMLLADAPQPVKFALGENVKQSNSPRAQTRFPGTRMGVEATMRRAFTAAQRYRAEWDAYLAAKAAGRDLPPPRKDLRLGALVDILEGRIWVNCHCYRADEILRLFAVAEDFGFRVAVLQHVLEGYRVMPEMARHGCGASTFSDWWAYKMEAYDAIPHNAAMMSRFGICATVNSDSAEVTRHLNVEAAKSIKNGGLDENQALRLCTLNGAIQLGIDHRVGSIEVGKDGDLAVFDGHPLDTFAKCVLTLIDGEVFFLHRDLDLSKPSMPTRPARGFAAPRTPFPAPAEPEANSGLYAIVGATVHPVSGGPMENGSVVVRNGRIEAVGAGLAVPAGATVIDAAGLHVWPGLIDAGTTLGLSEVGQVRATNDASEIATIQPDLRTSSALNPFSTHIEVARGDGITTAVAAPGGGRVAGQACLIRLDGWSAAEMLVEDPLFLRVSLPSLPINLPEKERKTRLEAHREQMRPIEEFFKRAARYAKAADALRRGYTAAATTGLPAPEPDLQLEAMIPYVRGEKPVVFDAHSQKAILEALRFAEKHNLRPIVYGGREAWKCAELLAARQVPVIVATPMSYPSAEFEAWDSVYANAARLHEAGVKFCFATGSSTLSKNLGVNAGMAVAHGLDPDAAVRAMTLSAAEILGVADRLGSLEAGKVADLIVTTDHPGQATCQVLFEMIAGRPIELSSKHTRLYEQFGRRPAPSLPPEKTLRGPASMTRR